MAAQPNASAAQTRIPMADDGPTEFTRFKRRSLETRLPEYL